MGYVYIAGCVLFTVYGQLILKHRMSSYGDSPESVAGKIEYLARILLTDIWVISGLGAAFVASLFWMLALTRFQLSHAYPFMGASFVLVLALSVMILGEGLDVWKVLGTALIVTGIIVTARGQVV